MRNCETAAAKAAGSAPKQFATAHTQCPQSGYEFINFNFSPGNISTVAPLRQSNAKTMLLS